MLGLAVDIVIGLLVEPVLSVLLQPYPPIAIVAAPDAILGGTHAWLEGTFSNWMFVVSFLSSVFIAGLIVFAGDQTGVRSQPSTGAVVVLGIQVFNNATAIRRMALRA